MNYRFHGLFSSVLILLVSNGALAQTLPLPAGLIALDSSDGRQLLATADFTEAVVPLMSHFETQENQAFCGVASAVTVLNALPMPKPVVEEWAPYHAFTQRNIFIPLGQDISSKSVAQRGLTLEQLGKVLTMNGAAVEALYAKSHDLTNFKAKTLDALRQPGTFVIANFLRSSLGQEPTAVVQNMLAGHFSPIAAYNSQADRFLILDVARYKYPPVWVQADVLWLALATTDLVSGTSRGALFIKRGPSTGEVAAPVHSRNIPLMIVAATLIGTLGLGVLVGWFLRSR